MKQYNLKNKVILQVFLFAWRPQNLINFGVHLSFSGKDYWLGGLNPGLLFIWSNSAKPVLESSTQQRNVTIPGEGRCLKLAYNPALRNYSYKGADCSHRYSYICETAQNTSSNELRRLGKSRNMLTEE